MRYISNVINRVNSKGRTDEKYFKRMIKISDFYIINMFVNRLIYITDFFVKAFNPKSFEKVTGNLFNGRRSSKKCHLRRILIELVISTAVLIGDDG